MRASTDRILTSHTGSLPRPEQLVALMYARESGSPIDEARLEQAVSDAIRETVRREVKAGIDIVNDGEMSKPSYTTYVKDRLTGFAIKGSEEARRSASASGRTPEPAHERADLCDFPAFAKRIGDHRGRGKVQMPICVGPVQVRDVEAVHRDIERLKAALGEVPIANAFMTAISPGCVSRFLTNVYYPSHEEYLYALADAMRPEYHAIVSAGFVLQVDCPDLAAGRHSQFANSTVEEFRRAAALHIDALNHALNGLPPEQIRMHVCWGNYEGPHHHDVPLKEILDVLLRARPMGMSLEAANPRHEHEWAVFEEVRLPEDKVLLPGVIDSTTNYIEHPELVMQRIMRFAHVVGRERVIASSDCGFGTWVGDSVVDPDIAWAKLAALTEGARLASRQLWKAQ